MADESTRDGVVARELLNFASKIAAAYVRKNSVPAADLAALLKSIHTTLCAVMAGEAKSEMTATQKPMVSVRKSVTPDYVVCLEDGKRLKMLKRHLRASYNLTPEQYRAKWGLPRDYPMVAPNYAARRSEVAKKIGLGRKQGTPASKRRKRA